MLLHVSDYNLFFSKSVFYLICYVKFDRFEIQQSSGFLGVKVLRSILILSSLLHLVFSSGLFSYIFTTKILCAYGLSPVHSACHTDLTLFDHPNYG